MDKYETMPVAVEAVQFQPNEHGDSNVFWVKAEECSCAALAQDGHHCSQHGDPKTWVYRTEFGRGQPIRPGNWFVLYPDGGQEVHAVEEFAELFRPRTVTML